MAKKINRTTQPLRSQSDRKAMGSYLYRRSPRDYALFIFGIHTGRRICDLVGLNVADVAYIDRRGRLCVKDRMEIVERKTGKTVDMLIHPTAKRALSRYFRYRKAEAGSKRALLVEALFKSQKPNRRGEYRITSQHAWRVLRVAADACGISYRVGTHSLRKTFGYSLYQNGTSIELIQKLLNHSSPEVTLSYIGITRDDMDEAILAIS
jgi:integrase